MMAALRGQVPLSSRERRDLAFSPDAVALALHARRVAEGRSQTGLAEHIRVTPATVGNWEKGAMPVVATRVLSYVYAEASHEELWRVRALSAEAALQRITEALADYRGEVRSEMACRRNGHR